MPDHCVKLETLTSMVSLVISVWCYRHCLRWQQQWFQWNHSSPAQWPQWGRLRQQQGLQGCCWKLGWQYCLPAPLGSLILMLSLSTGGHSSTECEQHRVIIKKVTIHLEKKLQLGI